VGCRLIAPALKELFKAVFYEEALSYPTIFQWF
jgi:hypothetical protein